MFNDNLNLIDEDIDVEIINICCCGMLVWVCKGIKFVVEKV